MISIQIGFYANASQRPFFKRNRIDHKQQDQGMDKHT